MQVVNSIPHKQWNKKEHWALFILESSHNAKNMYRSFDQPGLQGYLESYYHPAGGYTQIDENTYLYERKPEKYWPDGERILYQWREVSKPFHATLGYVTAYRGRSAVEFIFKDVTTKLHYVVRLGEMDDILLLAPVVSGQPFTITGDFLVIKKGANFGIKLVC